LLVALHQQIDDRQVAPDEVEAPGRGYRRRARAREGVRRLLPHDRRNAAISAAWRDLQMESS
jgi:hypothetical protein